MAAEKGHRRIGVIVNNVGGYSRGVVRGVASFAFARAWTCRVQGVNEPSVVSKLSEFDGLIVQAATRDLAAALSGRTTPAVNVSSALELGDLPAVTSDDRLAGRQGAEHFLLRAFRAFVFHDPIGRHFSHLRHEGFTATLGAHGFNVVRTTNERQLRAKLVAQKEPLAVMGCNDRAAVQVLDACRELGLRVPEAVAVLGVDNDDLTQSLAYPPLSTINTARERIGFEAATLLERLLAGERAPTKPLLIPPAGVITRQSTDAIAIDDDEVADAVHFIRAHAGRPIGVADVLEAIPLSRRQLERRFRERLGRSILDEIAHCRIERARQLLLDTELTLGQVASAAGFRSENYFHTVFHKAAGTTPGRFRAQRFRGATEV